MHSHAEDLRAEVRQRGGDPSFVDLLLEDWRLAPLPPALQALCAFAEALTRDPGGMREGHILALRGQGFSDEAIHRAIQATAYFNYINRVADGLHVDLEPEMPPDSRQG